MSVSDIVASSLMFAGTFFTLVAAIGFLRLPDVFCRLHVTAILDTLGAPVILLGAAVYAGLTLAAAKLVLGIAFLFVTSPLVGHLLSRSALRAGYRPSLREGEQAARLEREGSEP